MYYSLNNPSPELRKAILKEVCCFNVAVPKKVAICSLIRENGVPTKNHDTFRQCIDNEIKTLVAENQLTIDNSSGLDLLKLTHS